MALSAAIPITTGRQPTQGSRLTWRQAGGLGADPSIADGYRCAQPARPATSYKSPDRAAPTHYLEQLTTRVSLAAGSAPWLIGAAQKLAGCRCAPNGSPPGSPTFCSALICRLVIRDGYRCAQRHPTALSTPAFVAFVGCGGPRRFERSDTHHHRASADTRGKADMAAGRWSGW